MHFFHARFWRIFIIIQLKEVNFHVFQIRYWKKNTESKFYVCFPSLTLFIFFMLNCQKMKIRGCSLAMWAAHDTFLFFKRSEAFIIIIISFAVVCWCRNGDCPFRVHTETETQRKVLGGERPEFSLFLSLLLSFLLLFILSISLSRVGHPRL